MFRRKNALGTTLVSMVVLVGLSACSAGSSASVAPPSAPVTSGPTDLATPEGTSSESAAPPNDLKTVPLKRTVKSGGLTFNIQYDPSLAVADWTADGAKSIRVRLTAVNGRSPSQKIYVTRASLRFTVFDADGVIPGPDPIVDTTSIAPGYLVTFPYRYEQSFSVPSIGGEAQRMQLDFKYEVASLVGGKSKDYTKQTANDTVQVRLNF